MLRSCDAYYAGSPQSILGAILADYSWDLVPELIPSRTFVDLLAVFNVDAQSARVALDRICKKGLLDRCRHGRLVMYQMSADSGRRRISSLRRLFRFSRDIEAWDGTWTVVIASVPEARKHLRVRLRTQLAELGFASNFGAVWFKPNLSSQDAARQILARLEISQSTVLSASYEGPLGEDGDPLRAFDLQSAQAAYQGFVDRFGGFAGHASARLLPEACLKLRIQLLDAWHAATQLDPLLPRELCPPEFGRETAQDVFLATYDSLGPGAEQAVREIAVGSGLATDAQLHYFSIADVRD